MISKIEKRISNGVKINDRVYGSINIDEPVLLELMVSEPLKRLKNINQAGASKYAIAGKTVSRYEHSLGVMILLSILGAAMEAFRKDIVNSIKRVDKEIANFKKDLK